MYATRLKRNYTASGLSAWGEPGSWLPGAGRREGDALRAGLLAPRSAQRNRVREAAAPLPTEFSVQVPGVSFLAHLQRWSRAPAPLREGARLRLSPLCLGSLEAPPGPGLPIAGLLRLHSRITLATFPSFPPAKGRGFSVLPPPLATSRR